MVGHGGLFTLGGRAKLEREPRRIGVRYGHPKNVPYGHLASVLIDLPDVGNRIPLYNVKSFPNDRFFQSHHETKSAKKKSYLQLLRKFA